MRRGENQLVHNYQVGPMELLACFAKQIGALGLVVVHKILDSLTCIEEVAGKVD